MSIDIGEIVDGSAAKFRRELDAAPPGPVTVRINSVGGIVDEALDMYRAIAERGDVTAYVTGLAASAATVPMCAADKVRMADGAQVMIHMPTTEAQGGSKDLRAAAEGVERTEKSLAKLYASRTGRSEKEILRLLGATTYLSADEALALGFIDEIVPMRSRDLASIEIARLPEPPLALVRAVAKAKRDMATNTPRQTNAKVDPQITQALGLEDDAPLETVLATIMAMMQAQGPPPEPEPAPEAREEPPPAPAPEAKTGEPPAEMVAAVEGMPPEQQAKVLAVHARTEARIAALESEARSALLTRVPANLRTWAKKQPIEVVRDFVAAMPVAPPPAATPPARSTASAENDGPTEAEQAVAKALGRPVDYIRRTPQVKGGVA